MLCHETIEKQKGINTVLRFYLSHPKGVCTPGLLFLLINYTVLSQRKQKIPRAPGDRNRSSLELRNPKFAARQSLTAHC